MTFKLVVYEKFKRFCVIFDSWLTEDNNIYFTLR